MIGVTNEWRQSESGFSKMGHGILIYLDGIEDKPSDPRNQAA